MRQHPDLVCSSRVWAGKQYGVERLVVVCRAPRALQPTAACERLRGVRGGTVLVQVVVCCWQQRIEAGHCQAVQDGCRWLE
jgi:hypothetical protein